MTTEELEDIKRLHAIAMGRAGEEWYGTSRAYWSAICAMPALIAEVERLQKRVAWLEGQVHQKPWLCARRVRGMCDVVAHPKVCGLDAACEFPEEWHLREMPEDKGEGDV